MIFISSFFMPYLVLQYKIGRFCYVLIGDIPNYDGARLLGFNTERFLLTYMWEFCHYTSARAVVVLS